MGPPYRGGPAARRCGRVARCRPAAGGRGASGRGGDLWDVQGLVGEGEAGRGGGRQDPKGAGRAALEGCRGQSVGRRGPG